MPDTTDYLTRIRDYSQGKDPLDLQKHTSDGPRGTEQITPEQWECFGIHAERGRITIRDLVVHMAGHDANHIEQIRRILG